MVGPEVSSLIAEAVLRLRLGQMRKILALRFMLILPYQRHLWKQQKV